MEDFEELLTIFKKKCDGLVFENLIKDYKIYFKKHFDENIVGEFNFLNE